MSESTQVDERPVIADGGGSSGRPGSGLSGSAAVPTSRWAAAWMLLAVAIVAGVIGWLVGRGGLDPDAAAGSEQSVVTNDPFPRAEADDPSEFFGRLPDEVPPGVREFFESLPRDFDDLRGTEPGRLFEEFFEGDRFRDFFGGDFGIVGPDELMEQLDQLRDGLGFDFGGLGLRPRVPDGYELGARNLRVELVDGDLEFSWSMAASGPEGEVLVELRDGAVTEGGDEVDLGGVTGYLTADGVSWAIGDETATVTVTSDDLSDTELVEFATVVAEGFR